MTSFLNSLFLFITISLCSCNLIHIPIDNSNATSCKIQAYIETPFIHYINTRYGSDSFIRVAIIPFDLPETFANNSTFYARLLATNFKKHLLSTKEIAIVEMFDRDSWPLKFKEFRTGNHKAIEQARNAGYDMVLVGKVNKITNPNELTIETKMIDTNTSITLWFSKTTVLSHAKTLDKNMDSFGLSKYKPSKFYFKELLEEVSLCTVKRFVLEDI